MVGGEAIAGEWGDQVGILDVGFYGLDGSELLVELGFRLGLVWRPSGEVAKELVLVLQRFMAD